MRFKQFPEYISDYMVLVHLFQRDGMFSSNHLSQIVCSSALPSPLPRCQVPKSALGHWWLHRMLCLCAEVGNHLPMSTYQWSLGSSCTRIRPNIASVIMASLNVVTDILTLCLPLPFLWRLQIDMERKSQLIGVFLLGGLYVTFPFHSHHHSG